MNVVVIRHAIAENRDEFAATGQDDGLRPLTSQGRKKMRRAAAGLKVLLPDLDLIATSPLVRARETAEIVARHYGGPQMTEVPALAPGAPCEDGLRWLQHQKASGTVALVGHEPDLGILVGWLLTGRESAFMEVRKGSACLLEFSQRPAAGGAVLHWFLKPSQLALLGEAQP